MDLKKWCQAVFVFLQKACLWCCDWLEFFCLRCFNCLARFCKWCRKYLKVLCFPWCPCVLSWLSVAGMVASYLALILALPVFLIDEKVWKKTKLLHGYKKELTKGQAIFGGVSIFFALVRLVFLRERVLQRTHAAATWNPNFKSFINFLISTTLFILSSIFTQSVHFPGYWFVAAAYGVALSEGVLSGDPFGIVTLVIQSLTSTIVGRLFVIVHRRRILPLLIPLGIGLFVRVVELISSAKLPLRDRYRAFSVTYTAPSMAEDFIRNITIIHQTAAQALGEVRAARACFNEIRPAPNQQTGLTTRMAERLVALEGFNGLLEGLITDAQAYKTILEQEAGGEAPPVEMEPANAFEGQAGGQAADVEMVPADV